MSLPDAAAEFARQLVTALEAEAHRDEVVAENERIGREIKAWARSAEKAREQRDDLLHAARAVTRPATWTATRMATLRAVVDRIEKELNGS